MWSIIARLKHARKGTIEILSGKNKYGNSCRCHLTCAGHAELNEFTKYICKQNLLPFHAHSYTQIYGRYKPLCKYF